MNVGTLVVVSEVVAYIPNANEYKPFPRVHVPTRIGSSPKAVRCLKTLYSTREFGRSSCEPGDFKA